jgi:hypothetical protein
VLRHVLVLLVEANDFLLAAYVGQHTVRQGSVSGGGQLATYVDTHAGDSRGFVDEVLAVQHF